MPPRDSDLSNLVASLHTRTDDLSFALDAGLTEAAEEARTSLHTGLEELEQVQSRNGRAASVQAAQAPQNGATAPEPSHNIEAEEAALGAAMLAGGAAQTICAELVADDFYSESHRHIFRAVNGLLDTQTNVEALTVSDWLAQRKLLEKVAPGRGGDAEGKARVYEIAALVPASANVMHYTVIVKRLALERRLGDAILVREPEGIADAALALARAEVMGDPRRAADGADWLHAQPEGCPSVWGDNDRVLWAEGEPLMIYGPDGVGKTSLAQQVVLHMCGVRREGLLGLQVRQCEDRPVLYLACDRPRQARRSLYRMVPRDEHEHLRGRLLVWEGPLPFRLDAQPKAFLEFALLHNACAVVIDSLKDVAVELTKPEVALRVNHAFQWLIANGVDLLVLHHPRKDPAGTPAKAKVLEDVYGDRNFVAGMGSVIALYGKAGDPIVELAHLKQPAGEVGPFKIIHDHDHGRTEMYEYKTYGEILAGAPRPLGAHEVAAVFYATSEPSKAEIEKARRELRKLVFRGDALEMKDSDTGALAFAAR